MNRSAEGNLTGNEIRETFLRFFEERGHRRVRSSSLVPMNDPTLLFTNAGMNQFKDVFLGLEQRDYRRATSCQKCLRAGGKHNDLENVGFTTRHHTFFEMLGNFSFGDYFKKEAIAFAWELVTSKDWFNLPKDKLYVSIFKGEGGVPRDKEAHKHWVDQGIPKDRIFEFGIKENFWAMGDTGPCGPCSEIYYDMGPAASDLGHKDCQLGCDCGRYVEIWNLVFMQFNRDASGKLNPLPKPSVDTGAGLERLAAVLQGKISNFDTDLFQPLMEEAARLTGADLKDPKLQPSLRIIADHSRAATFLISDGVIPSNEGRGYVLRKIIGRAIEFNRQLRAGRTYLFGREIQTGEFFLSDIASHVVELMAPAYPELRESEAQIKSIILGEEQRYSRLVTPAFVALEDRIRASNPPDSTVLSTSGSDLFFAQDTLGLRPELVRDFIKARGWVEAQDAEEVRARLLEEQRERGRASWKGARKEVASPVYSKLAEAFQTESDFYFGTQTRDCRIEAIVTKQGEVNEIPKGTEAEVVLDRTSMYAESGGQVADTGALYDNDLSLEVAEVRGAYYPVTGLIAHRILAKEDLHVGDRVATVADAARRVRNMRNHTATHLMHSALRNILGTHVKQAGSLVAPDHLRFDFSHFAAVDASELSEIEEQVNEHILSNAEIQTDLMSLDDALASGALAFFGDKYPEQNVRVVTIPDPSSPRGFYSKELCGGTHVVRTGEIGVFKILAEESSSAGIRRAEAITGDKALANYQRTLRTLRDLAGLLNTGTDEVLSALERQMDTVRQLEKQVVALKLKAAGSVADSLLEEARLVKDVRVLAAKVSGFDREALRQLADALRQKLGSGVVVLASTDDGKVALITAVTKDLTNRVHAGKIVQELAREVGGSGGGRPDLGEAGGKDTSGVEKVIAQVVPLLERML